jgi:acetyltransferase-like isoleucine patch superfamily enzyme
MKNIFKKISYKFFLFIRFDLFVDFLLKSRTQVRLLIYKKKGINLNFIPQGSHEIMIAGDLRKFEIHSTSHLKSDTFIECSGGVKIGKYFHTGKGLTIFSTNHNYNSIVAVPYDDVSIDKPVEICDCVWFGANVSVVPGVTIGSGAVVGMGSVVTRDVPSGAIVGGNPAVIIGHRDMAIFQKLVNEERFN